MKQGVEQFIFNGANLMWPGIMSCSELGLYSQGTIVVIAMSNRAIIAVGEMN
jgi:predicted RNA-binding protein (TIGR00451 family)